MAAVIGMPDAYYEWLRDFYASRRSRMLGILESHGFRYTVPEGAYYVMGDSRHLGRGLVRFAFPKKDEPLDETERRFARLSGRS